MKVAVLLSGGKDSLYALWVSIHQGYEISCLITLIPESVESWIFHYPASHLTHLQAEALGIPLLTRRTGDSVDRGLRDLRRILRKAVKRFKVGSVVSGVVASDYQRTMVDMVCEELGLKSFKPLWGKCGELILDEVLEAGFKVIIVSVAAEGLSERWLGKALNPETVKELKRLASKYRFNPSGEGGEYETLVLDAPIFERRLRIKRAEKVWMGDSGYLRIEKTSLEAKT